MKLSISLFLFYFPLLRFVRGKSNSNQKEYVVNTLTVDLNDTRPVELVCDYHHEIQIKSANTQYDNCGFESSYKVDENHPTKQVLCTHVISDLCDHRQICKFNPTSVAFKKYNNKTELYVPNLLPGRNCTRKLEINYKCVDKFMTFLREKNTTTHMLSQQNDHGKLEISCFRRDYIEIMSVKFAHYKQDNATELNAKAQELTKHIYDKCDGKKACVYTNTPDVTLGVAEVAYRCSEPTYSYYQYDIKPVEHITDSQHVLLSTEMANLKMVCPNRFIKVVKAQWEVDNKCFPQHNVFDRTDILRHFCDGKAVCSFIPASYDPINNQSLKYLNLGGACNSEHYHKLKIVFDCIYHDKINSMNLPNWIKQQTIDIDTDTNITCEHPETHSIDFYSAYWGTDQVKDKPACYDNKYIDFSEKLQEYFQGKDKFQMRLRDVDGENILVMPLLCRDIPHKLKLRYACRKFNDFHHTNNQLTSEDVLNNPALNEPTEAHYLPPKHQSAAKQVNIRDGTVISIMSTFDKASQMVIGIGTKIRLLIETKLGENTLTLHSDKVITTKKLGTDLKRFVTTVFVLDDSIAFNFEYMDGETPKFELLKHAHVKFQDNNVTDLVKMYSNTLPNEFKIYYGNLK